MKKILLPLFTYLLLLSGGAIAQMKLTEISKLPTCSEEELVPLRQILGIVQYGKGGAGGSILKWSEELKSVIVYPGEDGKTNGTGGTGAEQSDCLTRGVAVQIQPVAIGMKFTFGGHTFILPWELVKDLQRKAGAD